MRVTKENVHNMYPNLSETEAKKELYKEMIKVFQSFTGEKVIIPLHAMAIYLSRKFLNKTQLHDFSDEQVYNFVSDYTKLMSNLDFSYFVDTIKLGRLTYGYASMLNNVTYHEFCNTVGDNTPDDLSKRDFFSNLFRYKSFITSEDYALLNRYQEEYFRISYVVTLGFKYLNDIIKDRYSSITTGTQINLD